MASTDKPRLSDAQKKANHIESERKRRDAIRRAFDALSEVVPHMEGQARSEAVMLQGTVDYMTELSAQKDELREIAQSKGISDEEFDALYEDMQDSDPDAADAESATAAREDSVPDDEHPEETGPMSSVRPKKGGKANGNKGRGKTTL